MPGQDADEDSAVGIELCSGMGGGEEAKPSSESLRTLDVNWDLYSHQPGKRLRSTGGLSPLPYQVVKGTNA